MTDISVIKMIISVAVWRIYPSWVNDKLWEWEWLGHSGMFWARLSRDDFRSKLENISFPSGVMSVSKSFFCFPRFWKIWRQMFKLWGFWFRRCFGALFENSAPSPGIFFCELLLQPQVFLEKFLSFFQSRAGFTCLTAMAIPSLSKALWWWYVEYQNENSIRALARSSAEGPSIVVAIGTSRVRWSMVQKRKKNTRKSACDCAKAQPFIINKPASFEEPVSETRRRYRFALRCFRGRGCTAAGRSGCSAGTAKKSSHPWHFRCWSLRRNELACTDLVHWTEALHRFSSRDAIIVVGSVLEKHLDGDFTPDQEKKITFKRWPPGYQSWKLGLALNGLKKTFCRCLASEWS